MRYLTSLLIALIVLVTAGCARIPVCSVRIPPPEPLSGEVSLLDTLDTIEGRGVGYSGRPGRFHTLAKQFLANGTPADFERLANDKVPLTRCMGLYCLARSKAPRAVTVLQAHSNDDWPVMLQVGCVGERTTVGGFAARLLRNRNYLELGDPDPLLPAAQVFVTDALRLASDKPFAVDGGDGNQRDLVDSVSDLLWRKRVTLDAKGFAEVLKHLPAKEARWRLVKGIGRAVSTKPRERDLEEGEIDADTVIRDFLIGRLRDRREDSKTRLAAASALTRFGDDPAAAALQAEAQFLDETEGGRADRFLAAVELRKTLWRWVAQIGPFSLLPEANAPESPAERATSDHPMVLEYAYIKRGPPAGGGGGGIDRGDGAGGGLFSSPRVELADGQLARLAKRIGEFGHAWDTYSEAVWELERMSTAEMSTEEAINGEIVAIRRDVSRAIRARE